MHTLNCFFNSKNLQSPLGQLLLMFWINLRIREGFGELYAHQRCSTCPGEHDMLCRPCLYNVIDIKMPYTSVLHHIQLCAHPWYASIPVLPVSLYT